MLELIFFFLAVLFLLGLITVTILYYHSLATRVNPEDCPQVKGNFAVIPSRSIPPLRNNACPQGGECRFNVKDLGGAINQCNTQPNLCKAFIVSPTVTGMTMWYVDPTERSQAQAGVDLYVRQT